MASMKRLLIVNPPIYDFTAYDFWLKPYGALTVAGYLQNQCEIEIFDFLEDQSTINEFGIGSFSGIIVDKPQIFSDIPRHYRRYGKPEKSFAELLKSSDKFDYILIQTVMTYWYPGYKEAIETARKYSNAKIILGGVYATLCTDHARSLKPDFVHTGTDLSTLFDYLNVSPDMSALPYWQGYEKTSTAVMKLTDGCPFNCSYCSVPQVYNGFQPRSADRARREFDSLSQSGVKNIAFYDDALIYKFDEVLKPFLECVIAQNTKINFHTPNALNARFITQEIADLMVAAGFKTFFIGYESTNPKWQRATGGKVYHEEFAHAVERLINAGADRHHITAYLILGHPQSNLQHVQQSMQDVNSLGVRSMLADYSPIPGTPDGEKCIKKLNLTDPLAQNKSAVPVWLYGFDEINRLKNICRKLNRNLQS